MLTTWFGVWGVYTQLNSKEGTGWGVLCPLPPTHLTPLKRTNTHPTCTQPPPAPTPTLSRASSCFSLSVVEAITHLTPLER